MKKIITILALIYSCSLFAQNFPERAYRDCAGVLIDYAYDSENGKNGVPYSLFHKLIALHIAYIKTYQANTGIKLNFSGRTQKLLSRQDINDREQVAVQCFKLKEYDKDLQNIYSETLYKFENKKTN
jgi:hypothetical protein